jgi:hypothetical protein
MSPPLLQGGWEEAKARQRLPNALVVLEKKRKKKKKKEQTKKDYPKTQWCSDVEGAGVRHAFCHCPAPCPEPMMPTTYT